MYGGFRIFVTKMEEVCMTRIKETAHFLKTLHRFNAGLTGITCMWIF